MADAQSIESQVAAAAEQFARRFGRPPRFAAVAPGRVNLIGEHVDYNDGFVLPMAIQRQTVIVAAPAPAPGIAAPGIAAPGIAAPGSATGGSVADERVAAGKRATIVSADMADSGQADTARFDVDTALAPGEPGWSNYVRGVVAGCLAKGLDPGGFDALVHSTVPPGGGLSSSAALEVAVATVIEAMCGAALGPVDKALLCQQAEHQFARMPCGIMDQFISVLAQPDHALLLDCRSRQYQAVAMTDPAVTVLIVNSNVRHELSDGEYARRRAQCQSAAAALEVASLRDATVEQLMPAKRVLEPAVFRRAYHVLGEIERTVRAATLAEAGDWVGFGRLMYDSHTSLRDAYEVSCPELDLLVELAAGLGQRRGVFGSRMTGGGFGGCTVSLVASDVVDGVTRYLASQYKRKTGIEATTFATRPAAGARVVALP